MVTGNAHDRVSGNPYGLLLCFGAISFWICMVYWTVASKFLGPFGITALDWMQKDDYYCHVVGVLLPSLLLFRYWGWVSAEVFTKV